MSKLVSKHKSRRFRRFLRANEAVSALEYAILVGVITVAIGAALAAFSGKIGEVFTAIGTNVSTINTPTGTTINAPGPT